MKKALILLLVILLPTVSFTGCRDLTEPEDMSLVSIVGFNTAQNNRIEMVYQDEMLNPGGMQTPKSNWNFQVHKSTGSTIYDAVQNSLKTNPQKIYFSHTKVIIISEELASQQGIRPVIDFLGRNPEIRQNTLLLVSKKGEFEKIFFPDATENADSGKLIQKIVKGSNRDAYTFDSKLKSYLADYWNKNRNPYALGVSTSRTSVDGNNVNQGYNNVKANTYNLELKDIAVFKTDKMVGWLTDEKSRGFLYATEKLEGGIIHIDYKGKPVSLKIQQTQSSIKPVIENDKAKINIRVNLKADIGESYADIDLDEKSVIDQIGQMLDKQVKDEIKKAVDESKSLSTDVFGFGDLVYEDYPNYWRQHGSKWSASYPKLDVNVEVVSKILHIGLRKKPTKNTE